MTYEHIQTLFGMVLTLAQPAAIALAAYWAYRAKTHSEESLLINKNVEKQTNGLTDKLVKLTQKSSYAEGKLEGEKHP